MGKEFTTAAQAKHHARRELLKTLSVTAKILVAQGRYETVNAALVDFCYRKDEHQVFNTFWQWKDLGQSVKKGAEGFAVWGSPIKRTETNPEAKEDEFDFWPMCYLFSNAQVEPTKPK